MKASAVSATTLAAVLFGLTMSAWAQKKAPLELVQTIPLPGVHRGMLDHFAVDLEGQRLFLALEHDEMVGVFDLRTNKLIHTISGVQEPHSFLYRPDLKKLFVVDGGAGMVKIYEGDSYNLAGSVELAPDADSMAYDPSTKYMYVASRNRKANPPYVLISVVDTTAGKKLTDVKIDDADGIDGIALEKSGPRMFFNIPSKDVVVVMDREERKVIATWPIEQGGQNAHSMKIDEAHHRLFVVSVDPPRLIVLDTDSGKVVTSLPCVTDVDDINFDPGNKRIYISGSKFVDVFQQQDADHYEQIGHVPTAFHAQTAILVPELNRYYLAVPPHGAKQKEAELRVYKVLP
jgi:DNA-binding beta-propeller fold protein YncE